MVHEDGARGSRLAVAGVTQASVHVPAARVRQVLVEVERDAPTRATAARVATRVTVTAESLDVTVTLHV